MKVWALGVATMLATVSCVQAPIECSLQSGPVVTESRFRHGDCGDVLWRLSEESDCAPTEVRTGGSCSLSYKRSCVVDGHGYRMEATLEPGGSADLEGTMTLTGDNGCRSVFLQQMWFEN